MTSITYTPKVIKPFEVIKAGNHALQWDDKNNPAQLPSERVEMIFDCADGDINIVLPKIESDSRTRAAIIIISVINAEVNTCSLMAYSGERLSGLAPGASVTISNNRAGMLLATGSNIWTSGPAK